MLGETVYNAKPILQPEYTLPERFPDKYPDMIIETEFGDIHLEFETNYKENGGESMDKRVLEYRSYLQVAHLLGRISSEGKLTTAVLYLSGSPKDKSLLESRTVNGYAIDCTYNVIHMDKLELEYILSDKTIFLLPAIFEQPNVSSIVQQNENKIRELLEDLTPKQLAAIANYVIEVYNPNKQIEEFVEKNILIEIIMETMKNTSDLMEQKYAQWREQGMEEGMEKGIMLSAWNFLDIANDETISEKTGIVLEVVKKMRADFEKGLSFDDFFQSLQSSEV